MDKVQHILPVPVPALTLYQYHVVLVGRFPLDSDEGVGDVLLQLVRGVECGAVDDFVLYFDGECEGVVGG